MTSQKRTFRSDRPFSTQDNLSNYILSALDNAHQESRYDKKAERPVFPGIIHNVSRVTVGESVVYERGT